jgi:hypothetical protein
MYVLFGLAAAHNPTLFAGKDTDETLIFLAPTDETMISLPPTSSAIANVGSNSMAASIFAILVFLSFPLKHYRFVTEPGEATPKLGFETSDDHRQTRDSCTSRLRERQSSAARGDRWRSARFLQLRLSGALNKDLICPVAPLPFEQICADEVGYIAIGLRRRRPRPPGIELVPRLGRGWWRLGGRGGPAAPAG